MKAVVVAMTTANGLENDTIFNEYMENIHGPDLEETPGLYAWTRYENCDAEATPRYLHVYEFEREDAGVALDDLLRIAAKKREVGRGIDPGVAETLHIGGHDLIFSLGEQFSPEIEGMQVMLAGISDEHVDWYNKWYNTQHLPAILESPGFTNGYRFKQAKARYTQANYFHAFIFDTTDYSGLSAGLKKTMSGKDPYVASSQGRATVIMTGVFKRRGFRHIVQCD